MRGRINPHALTSYHSQPPSPHPRPHSQPHSPPQSHSTQLTVTFNPTHSHIHPHSQAQSPPTHRRTTSREFITTQTTRPERVSVLPRRYVLPSKLCVTTQFRFVRACMYTCARYTHTLTHTLTHTHTHRDRDSTEIHRYTHTQG